MCDRTNRPLQRYNIRNCAEFTSTILSESEDYNSCFILSTVVNNLQEGQQIQDNSCFRYVNFRTNLYLTLICPQRTQYHQMQDEKRLCQYIFQKNTLIKGTL